jgi:hypothetical protein
MIALGLIGLTPARAADAPPVGITDAASAAIGQMSKTLSAKDISFEARTIRVYQDEFDQPLHIYHDTKVLARRPDRLAVHRTGDDGVSVLTFDGKTATLFGTKQNKYARIEAPGNIEAMLGDVAERLNLEFPFSDFLAANPGKSFLDGVTSGRELDPVTIDGKPARHLFFSQTGGIEVELWVDKSEQAIPKRLFVTYRLLPGQPNFIAEFSDWNFAAQSSDSDFAFQPPAGAKEVELQGPDEKKGTK